MHGQEAAELSQHFCLMSNRLIIDKNFALETVR